jgi:hypothetical protein
MYLNKGKQADIPTNRSKYYKLQGKPMDKHQTGSKTGPYKQAAFAYIINKFEFVLAAATFVQERRPYKRQPKNPLVLS